MIRPMIAAAPAPSQNAEILFEAREALAGRLFEISRNLRLEFREGFLMLYGRVSSYYQKQVAQEAVRRLDAVDQVVNHIEVA
jgi:osmotically-inducible protein OsmY